MAGIREMAIDFRELDRLLDTLTDDRQVRSVYDKAVGEGARVLVNNLKAATPKGATGNLRRSVGQVTSAKARSRYGRNSRRGVVRIVGFRALRGGGNTEKGFHAHLIEDGTVERQTKAGRSTGRVAARNFAFPVLNFSRNMIQLRVLERARAEIARLVEKARNTS